MENYLSFLFWFEFLRIEKVVLVNFYKYEAIIGTLFCWDVVDFCAKMVSKIIVLSIFYDFSHIFIIIL